MHAGGADVSLRCHNSPRWKTGLASANDVMHRKHMEDLGNLKKVSWVETRHRTRRLTFACLRRPLWRVPHVLGQGRWKSQHRKIVPLSPYVDKPLNSKVIKSFVPELRSLFYIYIYIYINKHSMYISHIALSWLWYRSKRDIFLVDRYWLTKFFEHSSYFFNWWC